MPSGLVALLDDVSVIAKMAAASLDDMGAAAGKAAAKAAGVVVDDAAVTPTYVTEFTPDRELPIIWAIAKGSLRNKLFMLLPGAMVLSQFLPMAVTPLLMLGALYLCFEGAEKILEKLGGDRHGETLADPIPDMAEFERERISGAIRTDFILSAEIMAIALAEVAEQHFVSRALILAAVAVVITALVYGAVALIVKMDDAGLHLARRGSAVLRGIGSGLVHAMPWLLNGLSTVGVVAMLWVGGGIILHGSEDLGLHGPAGAAHAIEHAVAGATDVLGGALGWVAYALTSAALGLVLGVLAAMALHVGQKVVPARKAAN